MKKSFIFIIKYMPIIQLVGIFVVNIIYYFKLNNKISYINNYLFGNSIIVLVFLYIASKIFGFCEWHRIAIVGNFINITISTYDQIFTIPISNLEILVLYSTISIVFLFIALYYKFKCNRYEESVKSISERIKSCCR